MLIVKLAKSKMKAIKGMFIQIKMLIQVVLNLSSFFLIVGDCVHPEADEAAFSADVVLEVFREAST